MSAAEFAKKVNAIDWSKVEHAYGEATDVPGLFAALAEGDAEAREKAWFELYGNLWHQGTIYEATVLAAPLLVDLLRLSGTEKQKILVYLAALYFGQGYSTVHESAPGLEQERKAEAEWIEAIQAHVAHGAEAYLSLLRDGDVPTRIAAAYLLGVLRVEDIEETVVVEEIARAGLK